MQTPTRTNGEANLLDIVTYEDRANPRRQYVVTQIIDSQWGRQFGLIDLDTDERVVADLRQYGWQTWANAARSLR